MHSKLQRGFSVATLIIAASCFLQADTICVTGGPCGANWQPFVTPIQHAQGPGPTGTAYFDGWSYDGPNENVAYFIEGQGAFQGNPYSPDAQLPFWGNTDGSAVPSFYFQSGGVSQTATLLVAGASWSPENSLGWYDPDSDAWGWIFQANGTSPTLGESVTFTPTPDFGLFFVPDSLTFNPGMSYFTNSTINGIAEADITYAQQNNITLGPETAQHFAVFDNLNGGFDIGIADRSLQIGNNDYKNMIVELGPTAAPEPSFLPLMAGILVLFLLRKRLPFKRSLRQSALS